MLSSLSLCKEWGGYQILVATLLEELWRPPSWVVRDSLGIASACAQIWIVRLTEGPFSLIQ